MELYLYAPTWLHKLYKDDSTCQRFVIAIFKWEHWEKLRQSPIRAVLVWIEVWNRYLPYPKQKCYAACLFLVLSRKGNARCNTFTCESKENTCSPAVTATIPTDNTQSGVLSHTHTHTHTALLWMLIQTTIPVTQTVPRTKQVATGNGTSRTLTFREPTSKVAVKCVSLIIPIMYVMG